MPHSPATAQWELAIRIRQARLDRGLSGKETSARLDVTPGYLSTVENNKTVLTNDKIRDLVEILELPAAEQEELIALNTEARSHRWWDKYDSFLNEDLLQVVGLESGASGVRIHEGALITGLLQTPDYTNEIMTGPTTALSSVARRLELRQRRQARVTDENEPLRLQVMMSEAALMQQYGGKSVLRNQLIHLLDLNDRLETLELRVIPFLRSPRGMTGASTIHLLEFSSPHLPTVAWREAVIPIGITDDPEEVDALVASYDEALAESALDPDETVDMIQSKIATLG